MPNHATVLKKTPIHTLSFCEIELCLTEGASLAEDCLKIRVLAHLLPVFTGPLTSTPIPPLGETCFPQCFCAFAQI